MTTELWIAVLMNLSHASGFGAVITLIIGLGSAIVAICNRSQANEYTGRECPEKVAEFNGYADQAKSLSRALLITFVPLLLLSAVPTVDQLFQIRLGLIKFELASPENVKLGVAAIEEVAKKLECKYLGCPEAQKSEPEKKAE
jgi:hypothetical protein